uniref:Uncharacterized protein n=1 Tax=Ditylenchus dipsaci TaxID=166011 RepID=A0A915EPN3_9BILA
MPYEQLLGARAEKAEDKKTTTMKGVPLLLVVEHLTPDRLVYDPSVGRSSQPLSLIRPSIHSSRVRTPLPLASF